MLYFSKFWSVTFLVSSIVGMKHAVTSKARLLNSVILKAVSIKLISEGRIQFSQ